MLRTSKTKSFGNKIKPPFSGNSDEIQQFLALFQQKYNLKTPEDWNSITWKQIQSNGGWRLLKKYSMFEIKCMGCPEGKSSFNNPYLAPGYWNNQANIDKFFSKIREKYNLNTPEDWNSITQKQIESNGGGSLLKKHSMFEIKCMGFPEGKSTFNNPPQSSGYWDNQENIDKFLSEIKEKYNLNTPEDWNSITWKHITSNGGSTLSKKYSLYEIKSMAFPEGKSLFNNPPQSPGYWDNQENIYNFLSKIKEKYNLKTPDDWNSITWKHIQSNGGSRLLKKQSIFEIKCMGCPEGKSSFNNPPQSSGYWDNQENIDKFLSTIKEKYNLKTSDDWNSITWQQIESNGGGGLSRKHSIFEIKCMGCPEGKSAFNNPPQSSEYWDNQENILNFLSKIKEKYNLNTPEDWNSITRKHIQSNGGSTLSKKYSLYEIKCMGCPEGKSSFDKPPQSPGYWDNQENIDNFLSKIREKYNLHTPDDWNSITRKHIQSNGGGRLSKKYSLYEIKCMGCPEGKSSFTNSKQPPGYWDNQENIDKFLSTIREKYNLKTPDDWNSITQKHIKFNGGSRLLSKHSMFAIKCMGCPEGKSSFNNPYQPPGYWDIQENILNFLSKIKEKYNLNTPEDWNSINWQHIKSNGGGVLSDKYSMFDLKCMGCPEGKSSFDNPPQSYGYWDIQENILNFLSTIREKYNLNTPEDWKRFSKIQIIKEGGNGLLTSKIYSKIKIKFENEEEISISKLLSGSVQKRSSQRWLFLQIKKLYPHEEIVEDYFHSTISRISGANVQFDIFMIERNIAIEYHGQQHYEDIPSGFTSAETYKYRDLEKQKLCSEHGIQLIVIPYWWDNKLESLKETLFSKIKQK